MLPTLTAIQGWCPWCGDHMSWGGWGMMFGWTLILVVLILVVWAVSGSRWRGSGRSEDGGGSGEDRAESVLRERYARGEIDEEEYRRKLDDLRRE
ncbi:MAG: SHOCT domain-containing protein [Gemmatimonadota bacterium]